MMDKELHLSLSIEELFDLVKFAGRCKSFTLSSAAVCSTAAMRRQRLTGKDTASSINFVFLLQVSPF